jgi:hypothetical protein
MELTPLQIQQQICVRVTCNEDTGSGVLAFPDDKAFIYILTAKHVLLGKNFNKELDKKSITIDRIFLKGQFKSYQIQETDEILYPDKTGDDIAVIIIPFNALDIDKGVLEDSKYIDSDFGLLNCIVRGFPHLAGNIESRQLACLFEEFRPGYTTQYLIRTTQLLDTVYSDANSNVQGLSGGGVFFSYEGKSYLLGIIMKYADINSFYCIHIGAVNSLLVKNNYPAVKIAKLLVDERIKKTISSLKKNELFLKEKIKDNIGDLHLIRSGTTDAIKLIGENQLLLLYGDAGVGKSSYAKEAINGFLKSDEYELYLFNGEQFSQEGIDLVLKNIGAENSFDDLIKNKAFKTQKLFWIESVEKLVETNLIDALNELLNHSKKDTAIKIVITIRSYMLQQFLLRFGWNLPIKKALLEIPLLSENDLHTVQKHFPTLQSLLLNSRIIHLLKIPFYLNYAVEILPALKEAEDLNEQTFKAVIWDNVIDKRTGKRGGAFEALSIKRAKEMSLYTTIDIEYEIKQSLLQDNLIAVENDDLKERFTPSHDVLEDWALMRYIKRHKKNSLTPLEFFHAIGNEPAIRRAFRLWLGEALQNYDVGLRGFIQESLWKPEIEKYWKDEIYISILRSEHSAIFFKENEAAMLENDGRLLLKLIHIIKTACKEPAKGFSNSYFPILIGSGWASIVHFLYKHSTHFIKYDSLILSYLAEWKSKMYNGGFNFPEESRDAGLLLLTVLDRVKSNHNGSINRQNLDDQIEAGISLLFTLTKVIQSEVESFVLAAEKGVNREVEKPNYFLINFNEKVILQVLSGLNVQLATYKPDLVIDILKRKLELKPKEKKSGFLHEPDPEIEEYFGIQHDFDYKCYPPSSYQTPVYYLLKNHPQKALDFIIEVINNSTKAYLHSLPSSEESVIEVGLTLNDGSIVKQWGDHILWQMYRGIGNTPHLLQSILMALEKYLFELAEENGQESDAFLRNIYNYLYRNSSSIATTAVLASVGIRFPNSVGDEILPLISSKYTIQWDEIRYMNEHATGLPSFLGKNDIHENERAESDKLPHRKMYKGLNNHIVNLLLDGGKYNETIFGFLDAFHESLKADESVIWLKTLSEIDVRKWKVTPTSDEPGKFILYPSYEGKVKEFVEEGLQQRDKANIEAGYSNWINNIYDKCTNDFTIYLKWQEIQVYYNEKTQAERLFAKPGTLAIIGLRDFPERLTKQEKKWAISAIFSVVENVVKDREGYDLSLQRNFAYNLMEVKPCLAYLPFLFKVITTKQGILELKEIILNLLNSALHDHEKNSLLGSIRYNLWQINSDFALTCVRFLIEFSSLRSSKRGWQIGYQGVDKNAENKALKKIINKAIRNKISAISPSTLELNHYTHHQLRTAFILIPGNAKNDELIEFCIKYVKLHLDSLGDERNDRSMNFYEDRVQVRDLFSEMFIFLDSPKREEVADLLFDAFHSDKDAIQRHYTVTKKQEFVNGIIEYVIRNLDRNIGKANEDLIIENFWKIWDRFHERNISQTSYYFASLLLLQITWKIDAKSWKPLIGKKNVLTKLILYYGEVDLAAAMSLMSTVGEEVLLPHGISLITSILKNSTVMRTYFKMSSSTKLIQRCFYNHGKAIKSDSLLLIDFFIILDLMVDAGSTEAYLIRESLITFKTI